MGLSLNFGAYGAEILRGGILSMASGQIEAAQALGLSRWRIFRHVMLIPALSVCYPALASQFVLMMLGSSVVSAISATDLTAITNTLQSTTFRVVRVLLRRDRTLSRHVVAGAPGADAGVSRAVSTGAARRGRMSRDFGWHELLFVLGGLRWTLVLSAVALTVGSVGGFAVALARVSRSVLLRAMAIGYIGLLQGTPELMQLFLVFYGLAVLTGVQIATVAIRNPGVHALRIRVPG